ncbi:MAG: AraC family transcriptional regulator [Saprospiraceae bacterium]|nr:AraC family transcriptional regulator [Saprospiraceae bacterium]
MDIKVQMSIIKDIIYESANYGANKKLLAEATGFTLAELDDGERWVDLPQAQLVWAKAVELTQQAQLGLLIGRSSNPHVIGLLGYLMESCPDLGQAFELLTRFNPLFGNMFSYHHERSKSHFRVLYEPHPEWWALYPETARQAIETSMSRTLSIIHRFSGKRIWPQRACFRYAAPEDLSIYRTVLNTDLIFSAEENRLDFDQSLAKVPVASHNFTLYQEFRALAELKLAEIQNPHNIATAERVKTILLSALDQQLPSIDQTAEQLQCSTRTLQRRLREEGTSFQSILEEIRKELAIRFVKKRQNKLAEIASFLGYSDPRVFRRAFKRWTGFTPKAYANISQSEL